MVTDSGIRPENFIYAVPASGMIGVIFGTAVWFIVNTIRTIKLMGKNARGGSKMVRLLIFCHKMHELDPTFSTEYFRDKSMSLLKFMVYSSDPCELNVCRCDKPIPEKLREIVDITYRNSGVNKYIDFVIIHYELLILYFSSVSATILSYFVKKFTLMSH